jgi:hypothetical protein
MEAKMIDRELKIDAIEVENGWKIKLACYEENGWTRREYVGPTFDGVWRLVQSIASEFLMSPEKINLSEEDEES